MRVLAVADSDSYLKWAACLLRDLPSGELAADNAGASRSTSSPRSRNLLRVRK